MKIDIPQEFVGERDVSDVFMKYEAMIERFAETHKESQDGKSAAGEQNPEENMTTEELRGELAKLDSEKSGLQLRLKEVRYRVQQALQHERDADKFIGTVKRLRLEEQKTSSIREQIGRVRREVMQLEQQLGSGGLRAELQHARDANDKSAVQLLEMAEADLAGLLFRKDKIFSLIDQKRGEMTHLQTIAHQTLFPRSELDALQNQIEAEQNRINQLMEAKVKRRQSQGSATRWWGYPIRGTPYVVPHGVPPSHIFSRKKLFSSIVLIIFGVFNENMAISKLFLTKLHDFEGFR